MNRWGGLTWVFLYPGPFKWDTVWLFDNCHRHVVSMTSSCAAFPDWCVQWWGRDLCTYQWDQTGRSWACGPSWTSASPALWLHHWSSWSSSEPAAPEPAGRRRPATEAAGSAASHQVSPADLVLYYRWLVECSSMMTSGVYVSKITVCFICSFIFMYLLFCLNSSFCSDSI